MDEFPTCPDCNTFLAKNVNGTLFCLNCGYKQPPEPEKFYFKCPFCDKEIKAYPEMIGQVGSCPYCDAEVTIDNQYKKRKPLPPPQKTQPQKTPKTTTGALLIECKACKKQISKNAAACPHCGEPNGTCSAVNAKSRSTYIILALLLGGLGIHSAYIEDYVTCAMHVLLGALGWICFVFPSGTLLGIFILGINGLWVLGDMIFVTADAKGVPLS